MSDPVQEPSESGPEPERGQPQEASLEDLVAALGRPRPGGEEPLEDEEDEAVEPEADPFAEYSDLDLATSLPIDPDDDLSKVEGEASPRLMSIIESLLFAADKPMTVKVIRRLLKEPTKRQIQLSLKQLIFDTQHRGVVLGQVAGGFRLRTHPDNAPFVQKMMAGKPVRLSRSQLESLAVVAYRQPVTKAELDHIRGVDCGAVLRVLLERDLAKIVGRKEEAGRPHLYGTTVAFLEFFNLKGLRDLPDLHEFKELSEESEATLRHTVQSGSLSDEQEAMGQSRIDFPEAAEGGGTSDAEEGKDADAASPDGTAGGPDAQSQEVPASEAATVPESEAAEGEPEASDAPLPADAPEAADGTEDVGSAAAGNAAEDLPDGEAPEAGEGPELGADPDVAGAGGNAPPDAPSNADKMGADLDPTSEPEVSDRDAEAAGMDANLDAEADTGEEADELDANLDAEADAGEEADELDAGAEADAGDGGSDPNHQDAPVSAEADEDEDDGGEPDPVELDADAPSAAPEPEANLATEVSTSEDPDTDSRSPVEPEASTESTPDPTASDSDAADAAPADDLPEDEP